MYKTFIINQIFIEKFYNQDIRDLIILLSILN